MVFVPAMPVPPNVAEQLHAYTREYGSRENSRPQDLYDMLLIAEELSVPPLGELVDVCVQTFGLRHTPWPPTLAMPPESWAAPWAGFVRDYGSQFGGLSLAFAALEGFWGPLLGHSDPRTLEWDPAGWRWSESH